jgi:hypothetical protein
MSNSKYADGDGWTDTKGRPLSDYSEDDLLDRELRAMASFLEYVSHCHQDVILDWMRSHANSDFVRWLRSFEHTGL